MPTASPPRHFSMIRGFHLADVFTLGNAACGAGAVFFAMVFMQSGDMRAFYTSCALAPVAFFFDVLDGRIARARHEHSALGRELDSLADVISFGVAPAALGLAAITVKKNAIPFDRNPPMVASGIRVGTPALTTRGIGEAEMDRIAALISAALTEPENEIVLARINGQVEDLCREFPLYPLRA